VKLFKKTKSRFYCYDFTVRGRRYRSSTQETKCVRALQVASLKLASVMEWTDPLPTKPPVLQEFADGFLDWVNDGRLEEKTRKFYRNGWRLLRSTSVAMSRVDQVTGDCAEQSKFPGSAAKCGARRESWVFPSKRSSSGHPGSICNLFRKARNKAGLPKELVLYGARHDYGTRVLMRTGNLAAVMRTMGHRDVKTAMHYQQPELEIVRAGLDYRPPHSEVAV